MRGNIKPHSSFIGHSTARDVNDCLDDHLEHLEKYHPKHIGEIADYVHRSADSKSAIRGDIRELYHLSQGGKLAVLSQMNRTQSELDRILHTTLGSRNDTTTEKDDDLRYMKNLCRSDIRNGNSKCKDMICFPPNKQPSSENHRDWFLRKFEEELSGTVPEEPAPSRKRVHLEDVKSLLRLLKKYLKVVSHKETGAVLVRTRDKSGIVMAMDYKRKRFGHCLEKAASSSLQWRTKKCSRRCICGSSTKDKLQLIITRNNPGIEDDVEITVFGSA